MLAWFHLIPRLLMNLLFCYNTFYLHSIELFLVFSVFTSFFSMELRHSLKDVLEAPSVMALIKDTKAAQEVLVFSSFEFCQLVRHINIKLVCLFMFQSSLNGFFSIAPAGSGFERFLHDAFRC